MDSARGPWEGTRKMSSEVVDSIPALSELGHVHIMGIGGAGMSGIARILHDRGVQVSGCDARDSRRLASLAAVGIHCAVGHDPAHLHDVDTLVLSTAIPRTHAEVEAAAVVLSRAEALALIMEAWNGIAVAGTHGKTTTTSMITVAMQEAGADPSFVIGSELNETGSNAHVGTGSHMVVEADESDGSFLLLPARVGIVTNVEPDHLNYWGSVDAMEQGFVDFVEGISDRGGFVAVCVEDAGARSLIEQVDPNTSIVTYGRSDSADYRMIDPSVTSTGWEFDISHHGVRQAHIHMSVPGEHNALNALGAFAVCRQLDLPADAVARGLESFTGTRRRFEFKGDVHGIRVFDDYAHHPTEIAATLRAARQVVGEGRLVVAFQAHHYYRTALFLSEFGQSLGLADFVVVLEVFAPGEEVIPGASGLSMAGAVPLPAGDVVFEPSWSAVAAHLVDHSEPGDIIMTLGAGDIGMLATEVLEGLRARFGEA